MSVPCEFYLVMNEDGQWEVNKEPEEASEYLMSNNGGNCIRVIKITAFMTAPRIEDASLNIPGEAGETEAIEVTAT